MNVTLNIIGAGHVGRVLGRLFAQTEGTHGGKILVQDVLTRSMASAQAAVAFIGAGTPVDSYAALRHADVTMLAVSDDQIGPACAALVAEGRQAGAIVFHCSGALASNVLLAATQAGAFVASAHPIRSFADPAQVAATFDGTFCGVEGDPLALAFLTPALNAIGARPVPIDPAAKTLYHAAAVFASNYLVTVLDAACAPTRRLAFPNRWRANWRSAGDGAVANDSAWAARRLSGPSHARFGHVQRQQLAVQAGMPHGRADRALGRPRRSGQRKRGGDSARARRCGRMLPGTRRCRRVKEGRFALLRPESAMTGVSRVVAARAAETWPSMAARGFPPLPPLAQAAVIQQYQDSSPPQRVMTSLSRTVARATSPRLGCLVAPQWPWYRDALEETMSKRMPTSAARCVW